MSDEDDEATRLVRRENPDDATRLVQRPAPAEDPDDATRLVQRAAPAEDPDDATRLVQRAAPAPEHEPDTEPDSDDATRLVSRPADDATRLVSRPAVERSASTATGAPTASTGALDDKTVLSGRTAAPGSIAPPLLKGGRAAFTPGEVSAGAADAYGIRELPSQPEVERFSVSPTGRALPLPSSAPGTRERARGRRRAIGVIVAIGVVVIVGLVVVAVVAAVLLGGGD